MLTRLWRRAMAELKHCHPPEEMRCVRRDTGLRRLRVPQLPLRRQRGGHFTPLLAEDLQLSTVHEEMNVHALVIVTRWQSWIFRSTTPQWQSLRG